MLFMAEDTIDDTLWANHAAAKLAVVSRLQSRRRVAAVDELTSEVIRQEVSRIFE